MSGDLLNGRPAEVARGRDCDPARDLEQLAGLLAEYPREPVPASRLVQDLAVLP